MLFKVLSAAVLATVFSVASVQAQSVRDLRGPAEQPPSGFKGQQYVDSRGCVFLRAGYGGQISWVPRVTRDRKQLCGYPASGGTVQVAEAAPKAAAPVVTVPKQPVATTAPLDTVASIKTAPVLRQAPATRVAAVPVESYTPPKVGAPKIAAPQVVVRAPQPAAQAAPRRVVVAAPAPQVLRPRTATEAAATAPSVVAGQPVQGVPSASGLRLACPADKPMAKRFDMHGGGSRIMCSNGDGTVAGLSLPRYVAGDLAGVRQGYEVYRSTKSSRIVAPPPGYKLAWDDDRLNVNRGKRTAEGEFQQDEIWTRTVPSELREGSKVKRKKLIVVVRPSSKGAAEPQVVASTKSAPQKKVVRVVRPSDAQPASAAAKGGLRVQVGTFGQPANADGAAARLQGLGLPVSRARVSKGGKNLQIIFAGPFASVAQAESALRAARGAGFSDAILR